MQGLEVRLLELTRIERYPEVRCWKSSHCVESWARRTVEGRDSPFSGCTSSEKYTEIRCFMHEMHKMPHSRIGRCVVRRVSCRRSVSHV